MINLLFIIDLKMQLTDKDTVTLDVHGLTVEDALYMVRKRIMNLKSNIKCIRVIHGYNSGTAIKSALTISRLNSSRIRSIQPLFLNEGITLIWLK